MLLAYFKFRMTAIHDKNKTLHFIQLA